MSDHRPGHSGGAGLNVPDTLRVALLVTNENIATLDSSSREVRGVGAELGAYIAAALGARFVPVTYLTPAAMVAGAREGDWDLTCFGIDPGRAADLAYGPAYLEIDLTYLVSGASQIQAIDDIDRSGVRIAVTTGNVPDLFLSRSLKRAALVRVERRGEVPALLESEAVDGYASHRGELIGLAEGVAGSRVLADAFLVNRHGVAVPQGRSTLLARIRSLVEQAILSGLVAAAVERAGLRGVRVARPAGETCHA